MNTKKLCGANVRFSALLALLLAGCSAKEAVIDGNRVCAGDGCGDVALHTLPDGTRCAVLVGFNKGAISCDWEGNRRIER